MTGRVAGVRPNRLRIRRLKKNPPEPPLGKKASMCSFEDDDDDEDQDDLGTGIAI